MISKVMNGLKKLEKVPGFVWCILCVITVFFSQMYSDFRVTNPAYFKSLYSEMVASGASTAPELAIYADSINYVAMWVFAIVFSALVAWGIFEIIARIIYNNLRVRKQMSGDKKTYYLLMRLGYSVVNLLVGLFNLILFFDFGNETFNNILVVFDTTIVKLIIEIVVFTFVYLLMTDSVIFKGAIASAYKRLLQFFCILLGVLNAYSLVIIIVDYSNAYMADLICQAIALMLVIGNFFFGRYYIYPKLLAKQADFIQIKIVTKDGGSGGNGYDFDSVFTQNSRPRSPFENEDPFAGPESNSPSATSRKKRSDDDDDIFKGFGI